jgi:pyruvate dehydrogenase E2 component (dihydrolipoamide acetyltransferase)
MFDIKSFSAVINPPQACILAVGASRRVMKVNDDDTISAVTVVPMTTACDGRIIDDALAAAFLSTIRDVLENPVLMLSHRSPPVAESRYDLHKLFAK